MIGNKLGRAKEAASEAPPLPSSTRRRTRTTQAASSGLLPHPTLPLSGSNARASPSPSPETEMPSRGRAGARSSSRGRTREKSPPYDRNITVFSPKGRVFQVDYALNSVKLEGITTVAVRGADSVCVVTQRIKPAADSLLDTTDEPFYHLFEISERLGMSATGMPADGRALAHQARNQAAEFHYKWGYEMPPRMLAQWIGDTAQVRTQHAGMRPYRVVATIVGIDEEKGTPELFTCDPSGFVLGHMATSVGLKDREAIKFLEEEMEDDSLSFKETIDMAVSALRHVLDDNSEGYDIEVGVVRKKSQAFRTVVNRLHK